MNVPAAEQLRILLNGTAQVVPEDDLRRAIERAAAGDRPPLRVKFGVDPTRPDLHLGHGVPLRKLRTYLAQWGGCCSVTRSSQWNGMGALWDLMQL